MEEAHRRHEPDPLALAAGRLERGAELGLGRQRSSRAALPRMRSARVRSASASYIGISSGAVSARAARWPLDRRERRRGRSGRSGPRRRARPSWPRVDSTSGASSSRPSSMPAAPSRLGRRLLAGRRGSWRRCRRRRGRRRAAPRGRRTAACRARARATRRSRSASSVGAGGRGGDCRRRRWRGRERSAGGGARRPAAPRAVDGGERVEGRGAADVADQGGRGARRRRRAAAASPIASSGTQSSAAVAPEAAVAASAWAARRTGIPAASAAEARLEPTRPRPTIAIGASSVGVGIRSRSSSRIGDTRRLGDDWCWRVSSGSAPDRVAARRIIGAPGAAIRSSRASLRVLLP